MPLRIKSLLILLAVWLITNVILIYRLNTIGAYATLGVAKCLDFVKVAGQANPASVRLDQSYTQWALALNLTDPSNYIKTGLGFADGKGMSQKNISPAQPNNNTYTIYYFQGAGTPFVIGLMIRLFGEHSVWPYFILISAVHFVTAILTCILARRFFSEESYILCTGLLSLICPAILDYDFATGLFSSEPLVAPLVLLGLIALSKFWQALEGASQRSQILSALGFGLAFGCAAYFRDIYATFANFSLAAIFIYSAVRRKCIKEIVLFALLSSIVLFLVQYPWEKRNQINFGEFTMSGSNYCCNSMWYQVWSDYKASSKWAWNAAMGMGNYLDPEKSKQVLGALGQDKKFGHSFALKSFIQAIYSKPWEALKYKLGVYDTLWFGQRIHLYIYIWCLISTLSFVIFLVLTRFKFFPELYLFPLFLLWVSVFAHFEHRYSQPFVFFITPITAAYVFRYWRNKKTAEKGLA